MAKTSGEIEKEFIEGLKSTTGQDLAAWLKLIKDSAIDKRNDIIKWLKEANNFGHMNASLLTGIYLNNGQPVYVDEGNLLENQFVKCEEMRPLFEQIQNKILEQFPETQLIPKKTYISFTAKREFAAINLKPKEIRLGLDLGEKPFDEKIQKSKLTGPMARISHMVVLNNQDDLDEFVMEIINQSYNRVNK